MKKLFLGVFLFIGFQAFAQENKTSEAENIKENKLGNNEIKLNVVYLLAGIPEVGYEYLINNESGVGINLLFAIESDIDFRFAITPYYRVYFGKQKAAGFFVEGFGMLNVINDSYNYDDYYYDGINFQGSYDNYGNETDFALGVSVGGKFMTNSGFVFEVYGGTGRNLFNNTTEDFVPRFGLTFGKRF